MAGPPNLFAATVLLLPSLPAGGIAEWSGAIVDIPADWALCDGTQGTPDLRDKFIIGAGLTFAVGNEGGEVTPSHTFTTDGHSHTIPAGDNLSAGPDAKAGTDMQAVAGTTPVKQDNPPYYSLAFIMKL